MKLSVKSDYAVRAVLSLARHYQSGAAQRVESLAAEQGVSASYLVQILIELKSQGLVKSVRGKEGGYLLAKAPSEISFEEVLSSIHGRIFDAPALSDPQCPPEIKRAWIQLQQAVEKAAASVTFQKLLDEGEGKQKMYYI